MEVGKLVTVGMGDSVGVAIKVLQAVKVTTKIEKIRVLQMFFIFSHTFFVLIEAQLQIIYPHNVL